MRGWGWLLGLLACGSCGDSPARPASSQGQHEITSSGELLTSDGRLREPGWARRQLLHWDPARVADPSKLRQWDFFTLFDDTAAVNLTLVDLGFVRLCSVGVIDFADSTKYETSDFQEVAGDVLALSDAVEGTASFTEKDAAAPAMRFVTTADTSQVAIDLPASLFGDAARGAFTIRRREAMPYLSLATPFDEDPHLFFYEQKIPGLSADGTLTRAGRTWNFSGAAAVMDWGRGAWPPTATWRWAAASGVVDGATLAFNLGEGFGDARAATENLIVYADVAHKLGAVGWSHDASDPTRDWTFHSDDGRVALILHPRAKELGDLTLGDRYTKLQKAYGTFSGTLVLDDGRSLRVDGLPGFAEEEMLSW
jgi:hypothetical protein